MQFVKLSDVKRREPVPGYGVRFIHSDAMTVAYWEIEAGAAMPVHSHPHEQIMNLIEGEFELDVAGTRKNMRPGMVAIVEPDEPHSGTAKTRCRVIDVFHPVREDYR
jgi:quercetin dioxygenase-like cupin family protein